MAPRGATTDEAVSGADKSPDEQKPLPSQKIIVTGVPLVAMIFSFFGRMCVCATDTFL